MRRFILPIAAILLTAACSSGTAAPTPNLTADDPIGKPGAAEARPAASVKDCPPTRDVLVWTKVPGLPAEAQTLGNYNAITCESTFTWLHQASPTDPGYCTEAAWASDNPGYKLDAEPAARLKKVQMTVGPAC